MRRQNAPNRAFDPVQDFPLPLERAQVPAQITNWRCRGKSPQVGRGVVAIALLGLFSINSAMAQGATGVLPTGESITAGSGSVSQSGGQMVINQASDRLAVDWRSFSIGSDNSVTFNQPSSNAIALNRVLGSEVSKIQGALNANGRVFLLNPNGIIFSPTSQINVGGLVASTLALETEDALNGRFTFKGDSAGSVINQGTIKAADGSTIALIAATIDNRGSLTANGGNVLMGAGSKVTLDLGGPVKLEVEEAAINALIKQGGAIKADGGQVYLTARAAGDIAATVINQTGIIEAQTLATGKTGEIYLIGDRNNGRIEVGGTLDASAPNGGNGGFIETSAARVKVEEGAKITTLAPSGRAGTWLIDPLDYTIAASDGDITGSQLSTNLGTGNITIVNTAGTGNGDIFVNDSVSWSSHILTLSAQRNIEINSALNGSGTAGLALEYGQGAVASGNTSTYTVNAPINLASTGSFSTKLGSNGTPNTYTIITALGAEDSATGLDLQGMEGNLSGRYVLGADIDAGATAGWDGGAGFMPVGYNGSNAHPYTNTFAGTFDGLGHTITNLTINRPATSNVGLFAITYYATIRNVGLVDGSFTGHSHVGALVGQNMWYTTINNSYATGNVNGNWSSVGGLVGSTEYYCAINNSYATGNVNSVAGYIGGLVGQNDSYSTISNSYATGSVTSISDHVGGLVGENDYYSTISNSYATGNVTGDLYVGGLAGNNYRSTISNAYATGSVSGNRQVGGLVGVNEYSSTVGDSFATGSVTGASSVGGLVGYNDEHSTITRSNATGSVTGSWGIGGLVGENDLSTISYSYATGSVTGDTSVGGLVGHNTYSSPISYSYATGSVTGVTSVGGLVGHTAASTISNTYATGHVSGTSLVGGLVGDNDGGTITSSYWDRVTTGISTSSGSDATYGKTTAEMMEQTTFSGWNFAAIWWLSEGNTRPFLRSEYSTSISNAHQLQLMALDLGASYTLAANINMAELSQVSGLWNSTTGFVPVGGYPINFFTGTFNGLGHTITDLIINRPSTDGVGLFGYARNATIGNVGLMGGSVSGNFAVGGLIGTSDQSTVSNAFTTGSVTCIDQICGGLMGYNSGTIRNAYATGDVTGSNGFVGGLVGQNEGTVSRSYATSRVTTASGSHGGLVGQNSGSVTDSYWNTQTSGQSSSAGGTGKTTAQMKALATFTGWDISGQGGENTLWRIYEGATAPLLRSFFRAAPTLTITADGKVYNGATTLTGGSYTLAAGFDSSLVQTGAATYHADSKNVGTRGILMQGIYSNQNDYDLIIGSSGTVVITPANLAVTGVGAENKTYDATNTATLNGSAAVSKFGSDTVNVSGTGIGVFDDKNVGTNTTVTVSGYSISGADSGNYTIVQPAGVTANITRRTVALTADPQTKQEQQSDPSLTSHTESQSGNRGLVNGESLAGALTRASGEASGAYAILQGTLNTTNNSNYSIEYTGANLTITAAPGQEPETGIVFHEPLQAALQSVQHLANDQQSGTLGGGTVQRGSGDRSGSPLLGAEGGNDGQNGGFEFVAVSSSNLNVIAHAHENGSDLTRVFMINGGINLPASARTQTTEDE